MCVQGARIQSATSIGSRACTARPVVLLWTLLLPAFSTTMAGLAARTCNAQPRLDLQARRVAVRTVRRPVAARAGNDSKVVREYREDDDQVVVPGSSVQRGQDGSLYADDSTPKALRPKDNMSKEMKQRLRQEYVSLGGAEGQVLPGLSWRPVVAALQVLEEQNKASSSSSSPEEQQEASSSSSSSSSSSEAPAARGSSKFVVDENELLASTWEHRLWTWGSMGLMGGGLAVALSHVLSSSDGWAAAGAALAAYVLADLGTGVYHWGVDNYGDGNTPMFGRQIAAFQGHHQRPWTITQREFCNNVHQVFKPAAYPAAGVLAVSPFLPLQLGVFLPSFLFLICMSQQFHAWSHMKKSQLPGYIVALQDANLLISRKAHGAHHKPNFEGNYCIVNGWWNPVLDNSGFFRWLEDQVKASTGVEPRCWYPPEHEWAEQVAPDSSV